VQVMKYAGRVLDLMEQLGLQSPRGAFLDTLVTAQSNVAEWGTGADVFTRFVEPLRTTPSRVAAHVAIAGIVDDAAADDDVAGYRIHRSMTQQQRQGRVVLWTGRLELTQTATGIRHDYAVASMHFGDVDFYCALRPFPGAQRFQLASARLWETLRTASLPALLRTAIQEFGPEEHGLQSVFPDGLQRISQLTFGDVVNRFATEYVHLYETNMRILGLLSDAGFELPPALRAAAEFTFSHRFDDAIRRAGGSAVAADYDAAIAIAEDAGRRGFAIDRAAAAAIFSRLVAENIVRAVAEPTAEGFRNMTQLARVAQRLGLAGQLGRAQELLIDALAAGLERTPEVDALAQTLSLSPTATAT
jgi:Domain of unknown function (DUF3536)